MFETVLEIVNQARSLGFRQLANGAKLYGHVPHVAPEAWLHQLYAALSDRDVSSLEENLGKVIPKGLRAFFRLTNGLGLFSGSLSIYGKRTNYVRSGDEAWQPFCIVTANTLERPAHVKTSQIVIGSYRADGSLMLHDSDGTVLRTKSKSKKVLNHWLSFWTMLKEEARRLATLFDDRGRKLSGGPTTPVADP